MMRISLIFVFSVLLFGLPGCFSHSGLYPVSVQINDDGKPINGVTVTFVGDDGAYAVGFTDAQGSAQMHTYKPRDGVKPGSYSIMLSKFEVMQLPVIPYDPATDVAVPVPDPVSLIPKKFLNIKTSGLTVVVEKRTPPLVIDIGE